MIYDLDDNPMSPCLFTLDGPSSYVFPIRINCRTGGFLTSESVSDALVEGRQYGDDDWTNLETTPLDTGPNNGTRQTYEIKITTDTATIHKTKTFKIFVADV